MSSHRQPASPDSASSAARASDHPKRPLPAWVTAPPVDAPSDSASAPQVASAPDAPAPDLPTPLAPLLPTVSVEPTAAGRETAGTQTPEREPMLDPNAVAPDYPPLPEHLPPAPTSPVVHTVPLHQAPPAAPTAIAPTGIGTASAAPSWTAPAAPTTPQAPAAERPSPAPTAERPSHGPSERAVAAPAPTSPVLPGPVAPAAGQPRFSVPGLEHVTVAGVVPEPVVAPTIALAPIDPAVAVRTPPSFDAVLRQAAPVPSPAMATPLAAAPVRPADVDVAPAPVSPIDTVPVQEADAEIIEAAPEGPSKREQKRLAAEAKAAERAAAADARAAAKTAATEARAAEKTAATERKTAEKVAVDRAQATVVEATAPESGASSGSAPGLPAGRVYRTRREWRDDEARAAGRPAGGPSTVETDEVPEAHAPKPAREPKRAREPKAKPVREPEGVPSDGAPVRARSFGPTPAAAIAVVAGLATLGLAAMWFTAPATVHIAAFLLGAIAIVCAVLVLRNRAAVSWQRLGGLLGATLGGVGVVVLLYAVASAVAAQSGVTLPDVTGTGIVPSIAW